MVEYISISLSIVAILGTAFSYLAHDRRLKKQERLINKYQLQKIEEEVIEGKKAKVRANLIKGNQGKRIIKVFNGGSGIARDIDVSIAEDDNLIIASNPFPYEILHPQDGTELIMHLTIGAPEKMIIRLSWRDDFKELNVHEQIITI